SHRHDRNLESNSHHTDSRSELLQLSIRCAKSFRKDNRTISTTRELSCVYECAPRTRHFFRQRIRVVDGACEKVRNACDYDCLERVSSGFEVGAEVFLHHRRCESLMPDMW